MKAFFYWGSALLVAVIAGLASVYWSLGARLSPISTTSGTWQTGTTYGSIDADMHTRAAVALFGLLALDQRETIYYVAATDDTGEPLRGDCTYLLAGRDLAARWWSITAYGTDKFLIPNDENRYSYSQTSVARNADGGYAIRLSATSQPGNWLPVKAGETFDVLARFYLPNASIYHDPAGADMPTITRESCR